MLDVQTRQRIDTARDILVGKVPDPKSQVEQITLALMYKFMDDMDALAEEFGGSASFFVGDFGRYSWRKIVGRGIGAFDALNLYSEGITRMGENPGLPVLFRSIFNNAYLPFRDPETLRAFLGVIDEFEYDNSERLGDAFEYLLSIMGSQGDAGQFRTPRHIIDFIVEIVDPKKDDIILDPACGTAGFLISAYKHIMKSNLDADSPLTSDERTRLAGNVSGYDISPDMVRLSLVNLYLHRFPDPDVFEYDTLTSEERWNEYANVILANPPFMSPKGGIRPHNRFSVTSRRSEVLFVDYIAEHLTPEGRAGVIVPEGIIFQSQNAHKQLRKMLVEDYLVAVVSLPPGVFNPYSGVKTSILILDKSLARRSETIGFFKVENDGFDLGAQRREIDQNDLPRVKTEVVEYLRRVREGDGIGEFMPSTGMVVEKSRVGEDGDYNLSGERYRVSVVTAGRFPMAKLGDVAEYINGMAFKPSDWEQEGRKIIRIQNLTGTSSKYNFTTRQDILEKYVVKRGDLLISWSATIGFFIWDDDDAVLNQHIFRVAPNEAILKKYLYYCKDQISAAITENVHGNTMRHITKGRFENIDIPLPSLEVQREIVSEIEGYQRVIDGARAVVENWRPGIAVDPEWPVVELGEVCDVINGSTPSRKEPRYWDANDVPWFTVNDIRQIGRRIDRTQQSISKAALHESSLRLLPPKTVLLCCTASVGEYAISEIPLTTNQQFNGLVVKQE
ncbi:MAG: N-6 DNA methylase, partial [Chloroflexi bacterium]|nr:N-6 DNA methylase [Chloroflexota bacterium]